MKRFLFVAAALLALASAVPAQAAPVPLRIDYTLPTVACSTINGTPVVPCDNVPLTGANALTAVDVWIAKAPIADTDTSAPTLSLAANVTTGTSTFAASDNQYRLNIRKPGTTRPLM